MLILAWSLAILIGLAFVWLVIAAVIGSVDDDDTYDGDWWRDQP